MRSNRLSTTYRYTIKANSLVFQVGRERYQYRVLPFGLGLLHSFTKAIVKAAQEAGRLDLARGHIDDILLASSDRQELAKSVNTVVRKIAEANWPLNTKKSVLKPTREIEFLGATWKDDGTITRSRAASVLA